MQDQNADVSSDRTMTFSLHCYGDIPYKMEKKLAFKKRLRQLITPESGFEDMSDMGSESRSTFPSLPPSLLGSRNTPLAMPQQEYGGSKGAETSYSPNQVIKEESEENEGVGKSNGSRILPPLLPEPIRLPRRRDEARLPQLVSANGSLNAKTMPPLGKDISSSVGSGILNLPPLIVNKPEPPLQLLSMQSVATSGVFEEEGQDSHMSTVEESEHSDQRKSTPPGSSSSTSGLSDVVKVNEYTELGRFCQGYAFDEIYCGEEAGFQYSGLVAGASYFFRVRCHNAAGWGPWSDTVKCMTTFN